MVSTEACMQSSWTATVEPVRQHKAPPQMRQSIRAYKCFMCRQGQCVERLVMHWCPAGDSAGKVEDMETLRKVKKKLQNIRPLAVYIR